MADNNIFMSVFLNAEDFDKGANAINRRLVEMGSGLDYTTVKFKAFADSTGRPLYALSALDIYGNKVTSTLQRMGRGFAVTAGSFEIDAKKVDDSAAKVAEALKKIEEADLRARGKRFFSSATTSDDKETADIAKKAEIVRQAAQDRAIAEQEAANKINGLNEKAAAQEANSLEKRQNEYLAELAKRRAAQDKALEDEQNAYIKAKLKEQELDKRQDAYLVQLAKRKEAQDKALEDEQDAYIKAKLKEQASQDKALDKQLDAYIKAKLKEQAADQKKQDDYIAELAKRQAAQDKALDKQLDAYIKAKLKEQANDQKRFTQLAIDGEREVLLAQQAQEKADAAKLKAQQRDALTEQKQKETQLEAIARIVARNEKKQLEETAKLRLEAAKAQFQAYAQEVAARQKLQGIGGTPPGGTPPPGFFSTVNNRLNPFATQTAGVAFGTFAGNLAASAVRNLITDFRTGLNEAIEFERQIARLSVTQRGTQLSTDQLASSVLNLSNKFNLERVDVVAAKLDIYQSSLVHSEAEADKLTETSAKLAKVTGATLKDSAEVLTTAINGFGLSANDANRVAELLFSTFKNGGPPIRETATVLGQLGASLSPYGVSINEIAAVLATFNKRGINANETLTTLTNIFVRLANPGTSKGLRDLLGGLSVEQIVSQKGLVGLLQDIIDKGREASDIAELLGQARSGKGFAPFIKGLEDVRTAVKDATKDLGSLDEAFNQVQDNAGEKLDNSLNRLKNAFIGVGESIAKFLASNTTLNKYLETAAKYYEEAAKKSANENTELDRKVDAYERLLLVLEAIAKTNGSVPKNLTNLARPFGLDLKAGKAPLGSSNEVTLGPSGEHIVNLDNNVIFNKLADEFGAQRVAALTRILTASEQEAIVKAQALLEQNSKIAEATYIDETKVFKDQLIKQVEAHEEASNTKQRRHYEYLKTVEEGEKLLTEKLKSNLEAQIQRAEEGVHKLESVAKRSADIRKRSVEEVQESQFQEDQRRAGRQLKLLGGADTFLGNQFQTVRRQRLTGDANSLVDSFFNKSGDEFLDSKNLEFAKRKIQELKDFEEGRLDDIIQKRLEGKATDNDILDQQANLNRALGTEYDLQSKIQKLAEEKEETTKRQADAQRALVSNLKKNIADIIDFNPFNDKNKEIGKREISGSPDEQLKRFDAISNEIKKNNSQLSIGETIDVLSKIKERRDQLVRELGTETQEKTNRDRADQLIKTKQALKEGKFGENESLGVAGNLVQGFDKFASTLTDGSSKVKSALDILVANLTGNSELKKEAATKAIADENANTKAALKNFETRTDKEGRPAPDAAYLDEQFKIAQARRAAKDLGLQQQLVQQNDFNNAPFFQTREGQNLLAPSFNNNIKPGLSIKLSDDDSKRETTNIRNNIKIEVSGAKDPAEVAREVAQHIDNLKRRRIVINDYPSDDDKDK